MSADEQLCAAASTGDRAAAERLLDGDADANANNGTNFVYGFLLHFAFTKACVPVFVFAPDTSMH